MADLEGRTLDRYQLEELMGRGGMADVYVAYDPHFERRVAIKVFKREDEELLRRFIREAHMMASLSHPHLMPVYDAGSDQLDRDNVYFIVMPLMEGGTLRSLIRKHALPLKQCCTYVREIASALDYVHSQGIIHRDIKSSNVLLDYDGRSYLADFGIARSEAESTQLTTTGNVMGTVDYIAPELFEANGHADELSDLYSFGVLLYEMVTGHLPFVGETAIAVITMQINNPPPSPRQYVPELSPLVEKVLLKALEKRPEDRYQSASELAEAFCRAASIRQTRKIAAIESVPTEVVAGRRGAAATEGRTSSLPGGLSQAPRAVPPRATRQLQPSAIQPSSVQQPPVQPSAGRATSYPGIGEPYQTQYPGYPPTPPRRPNNSRGPSGFIAALVIIALLAVIGATVFVVVERPLQQQQAAAAAAAATATANALTAQSAATQQAYGSATAQAVATQGAQAYASATAQAKAQQATTTAIAKATRTAQQHQQATATAQAQATQKATQTAQAHATATAGAIATAVSGTAIYSDPLTDGNSASVQAANWDTGDGCAFQSDGYNVTTPQSKAQFCHESAKTFQDLAAQADMTIKEGRTGGLVFRINNNGGYLFEVDSQGNYRISTSSDFSQSSITVLHDWSSSPAIKTGSAANRLQVIAQGGTLSFYANGIYLSSVTNSAFTTGTLGFYAAPNSDGNATVVYSNLSVYELAE